MGDLQYFDTWNWFQVLILAQLLFTQIKRELLLLRETLAIFCMQTIASVVAANASLLSKLGRECNSFSELAKADRAKTAQVLTETLHTFCLSPLSQGSLSCIIRDKSSTNLRFWPSYFTGSFCCHLHFHQHSAASSLLKKDRNFPVLSLGKITQLEVLSLACRSTQEKEMLSTALFPMMKTDHVKTTLKKSLEERNILSYGTRYFSVTETLALP